MNASRLSPAVFRSAGAANKSVLFAIIAVLLLGGVFMLLAQNRAGKEEIQRLKSDLAELEPLRGSQAELQRLRLESEEVERLRKEAEEIHRLRNETRQLKTSQQEMQRLQTENQQLKAQLAQARRQPVAPPAQAAVPVQPPVVQHTEEMAAIRAAAVVGRCQMNLKMLDGAIEQWALENKQTIDSPVPLEAIAPYLKNGIPVCPGGGSYSASIVGEHPACSIPGHVFPGVP